MDFYAFVIFRHKLFKNEKHKYFLVLRFDLKNLTLLDKIVLLACVISGKIMVYI